MNGGLGIAHLAEITPIGSDDTGVVFAATDLKLDRRVAVRVLEPITDEVARHRFTRESKVLGRLSAHPNVVTIYDAGFTGDDRPYLITELVDGVDLSAYLDDRGPMPWTAAAELTVQICAGLVQVHRSGVLHRDVRPGTIMMAGTTPKLTDFGISVGSGQTQWAVTGPATMVHRAPETFGNVWDERTDLYSLASVLHQMIDGRAPFWRPGADSAEALRLRLAHQQAPEMGSDLAPPALATFIAAALSKDPLDRPQSADEFAHELRLIREGRTTGGTPSVLHGTTSTIAATTVPSEQRFATNGSRLHGPPATGSVIAMPEVGSEAVPTHDPSPPAYDPSPPVDWPPAFPDPVPGPVTGSQWQGPGVANRTSVYSAFAPPEPMPPLGPPHHTDGTDAVTGDRGNVGGSAAGRPPRSALFLAAVAMMTLGVVGLVAVVAFSTIGSGDDPVTAPPLPDPTGSSAVEGGGIGQDSIGSPSAASDEEVAAMDMNTTVAAPPAESTTTETTVARIRVPDLVGAPVEAASKTLSDAGFDVLVVGRRANNAQPGTVTQQKPDAGDMVSLPLTVTLYIPRVSNLPKMVERSADTVCLELQALSLRCQRLLRNHDLIPAGFIIATNPVEGSLFSEGSTVELTVSGGPVVDRTIPDVAGQTKTDAETTLQAAGFSIFSFVIQPSESVPMDMAIGTEPGAGATLATDQLITVMLSAGPPVKVEIPDLLGRSAADAEAELSARGLTAVIAAQDLPTDDPAIGTVLGTDPASGEQVPAGSTVTVTVGRQEPPSG